MNKNSKPESKAKLFALGNFPYDFVRVTGGPGALLWLRPKRIYSNENAKRRVRGGALLISNHLGFLDPLFVMCGVWYRRHRFVCGQDLLEKNKVGTFFLRCFQCLPIDKHNPSLASIKEITEHLKKGELVSMFPEGYISTNDNKTASFKSGMILMAMRAGVPIIPVYLKPRKNVVFSRLVMVIGERVSVTEMYGSRPTFAQINEATALLQQREKELELLANGMQEPQADDSRT